MRRLPLTQAILTACVFGLPSVMAKSNKGELALEELVRDGASFQELNVQYSIGTHIGAPIKSFRMMYRPTTPASTLVAVELRARVSHGGTRTNAYIQFSPTIMKPGKWGFDVPASPEWSALFVSDSGEPIPAEDAKFWVRNGFSLVDLQMVSFRVQSGSEQRANDIGRQVNRLYVGQQDAYLDIERMFAETYGLDGKAINWSYDVHFHVEPEDATYAFSARRGGNTIGDDMYAIYEFVYRGLQIGGYVGKAKLTFTVRGGGTDNTLGTRVMHVGEKAVFVVKNDFRYDTFAARPTQVVTIAGKWPSRKKPEKKDDEKNKTETFDTNENVADAPGSNNKTETTRGAPTDNHSDAQSSPFEPQTGRSSAELVARRNPFAHRSSDQNESPLGTIDRKRHELEAAREAARIAHEMERERQRRAALKMKKAFVVITVVPEATKSIVLERWSSAFYELSTDEQARALERRKQVLASEEREAYAKAKQYSKLVSTIIEVDYASAKIDREQLPHHLDRTMPRPDDGTDYWRSEDSSWYVKANRQCHVWDSRQDAQRHIDTSTQAGCRLTTMLPTFILEE